MFAGLLLTAGSLGDRYGRRRSLFVGMAIFGVGSVLAAFSGSSATLIATRAFMGLGAAFVMPATLSIITNLFTDPKERARAIAAWAGVAGLGVAIGPITGGWLLEHFWWGSVFLVNVPFIVLALVAGRKLLPESRDPEQPRLDFVGAVLSIVGLTALVWTLIEAPHHGWTDAVTLGGLAAAAAVIGGFIAWERHTDHPMLDLGFFKDRRFSVGTGSITVVMFAMFGSLFVLTQLLQFVYGYTALQAGIRMLPIAGAMMVVAPSSAKLVERVGTKLVVGTGMAIIAVGLVLTGNLSPADGYGPVAFAMVVLATGMALVMAPATEAIMGSLPPAKAGVGSAVNDTTRELGGALGVAVLGSILSSAYATNVAAGLEGTPAPDEVKAAAGESLGVAISVANQIGGEAGQRLTAVAQAGFLDAMSTSLLVAAAVAGVGSVLTYVFLPSRSKEAAAAEADGGGCGAGAGRGCHARRGMSSATNDERRLGRPRDARVDAAVLDAARSLLAEKGYAGTTVEAIATRAGVGKATIYRRWPTREQLLLAVTTADLPEVPTPDTGDLREDLRLVFTQLAEQVRLAGPASYISDIIGESTRNPVMRKDFQAMVQQRRSLCAEIVAQARQRGEVRQSIDPDLVLDLISGSIFYRKLFSDDEADAAYVERRSTPCSTASSSSADLAVAQGVTTTLPRA